MGMKRCGLTKHGLCSILGALALLAIVPRTALAATCTLTYNFDIVTNPPGTSFASEQARVTNNARWGLNAASPLTLHHSQITTVTVAQVYDVYFSAVADYYKPNLLTRSFADNANLTYSYVPYSNTFSVTVAGTASNVVWHFSSPSELTNSSVYQAAYTNDAMLTPVPTGSYTVVFPSVAGYTSPGSVTTNITGASPQTVSITGNYERMTGLITVDVTPTNGSWVFTKYPADFADYSSSPLFGDGGTSYLTNAPLGVYTIHYNALSGWTPQFDQTQTSTPTMTDLTFIGNYASGPAVLLHVVAPGEEDPQSGSLLSGIGWGTIEIIEGEGQYASGYWHFPPETRITLAAIPTNGMLPGDSNVYDSFFFEWYDQGDITLGVQNHVNTASNVTFTIHTNDVVLSLLFSREKYYYDNVGDLDGDGLPDKWEKSMELDPKDATGVNGPGGNIDHDYIPYLGSNAALVYSVVSNVSTYVALSNSTPGYPLRWPRIRQGYNTTNYPFHNLLECRGLDGYFLTNVPPDGPVYTSPYGDDPLTDPRNGDTDGDGLDDGWEYYFWYWRSASSYDAGLTNTSANLAWVMISPCANRGPDMIDDQDNDRLSDLEEYEAGLDPTHADTDGDGMDDLWESYNYEPLGDVVTVSNALFYGNWRLNDDKDFMVVISNVFLLTNGTVGTAFTDPICYIGNAGAPVAAWVDVYTERGSNIFDLYHDDVLFVNAALTNGVSGSNYNETVYYGQSNGLPMYLKGYPVWVDVDSSTNYSEGDIGLVNPPVKHEYAYLMPPAVPFPGECSFNALLGWDSPPIVVSNYDGSFRTNAIVKTQYIASEEYLGGDYLGRVAWNAGGLVIADIDDDADLTRHSYTNPNKIDTDADFMPDGWELYVGLNPNYFADGGVDSDGDGLLNYEEWANTSDPYPGISYTWFNKKLPTDPGALVAPPPNDPHPADTDWDGLSDGQEKARLSNPSTWDTDGDGLPDAWEAYAGTSVTNADAGADPDNDGLSNEQEYWTGMVPEWQHCDSRWSPVLPARRVMAWDPNGGALDPLERKGFLPPDYLYDPCFLLQNGIITDLEVLRNVFPAKDTMDWAEYHTTLANNPDSDGDGMDDLWEVYHGLNPCKGTVNLILPAEWRYVIPDFVPQPIVNRMDAGANTDLRYFQIGTPGHAFSSVAEYFYRVFNYAGADTELRAIYLDQIVGPFNIGLELMDPDADGLPNLEEYSYNEDLPFYHTDPSPICRTDLSDPQSFASRNFANLLVAVGPENEWEFIANPFAVEENEGFDSDNDGVGDYAEINSAAGQVGTDPLFARNPTRNRALKLNGTNDFARTRSTWGSADPTFLTKFTVEAWVKPDNTARIGDQVIAERVGFYDNPFDTSKPLIGSNYRLAFSNGLAYIMYNGRGALRGHQAVAQQRHRLRSGVWTHLAGVYDGANLTIYVNGEASTTLRTAEIPANSAYCSHIIGARDLTPGRTVPDPLGRQLNLDNFFGGCVDEFRVWTVPRTHAEILSVKDRRLTSDEIDELPLFVYCSFDDLPDPTHRNSAGVLNEPVAPLGMRDLDSGLYYHPTINWWAGYPRRSTVYTGVNGNYNYLVSADNHLAHSRRVLPTDDTIHMLTNVVGTNALPPGYKYPSNVYGQHNSMGYIVFEDLTLFAGARGVATNSWLASLDPLDPDSTDSDGDGLPDWWEQLYQLDPYDATGDNGAWGDPDHDGLNNRAEYLAGTNPRMGDTDGDGIGDYDSRHGPGSRTWGELYMDGDGMPDVWEVQHGLDPYGYDAHLDKDGDGWDNYSEYLAGTDPTDPNSHPWPSVSGTVHYYGTNNLGLSAIMVWGMSSDFMDGPGAGSARCDASGNFTLTGLKQGPFKLFAFMDLNNDDSWNGLVANETATVEPCGQSEEHPYEMSWADMSGTRVGVSDSLPGYGRVLWQTRSSNSPTVSLPLGVNKISQADAPRVLYKANATCQMGEWDFQAQGIYGLSAGVYQWWVGSNNNLHGIFNVSWPASLAKPSLIYPRGDHLYYGRNMIHWSMDLHSTLYHLQVARKLKDGSYAFLCDDYYLAPYREADGSSRAYLPEYGNAWGNGVYYWRIASWNPVGESEWSDVQTFSVDLSATNSCWISGEVYYFGKALATNIYVEAFDNPGFSGTPDARVLYPLACTIDPLKTTFTLRGLKNKTYYVRAYADITPAGGARNYKLDYWESCGFVKDPYNNYQPYPIVLDNTLFVEGTQVVIRDRDTDNDHLPDAWEMSYFGNLEQTGDMDYDGDGENNLTEYALDLLDTDPTLFDTDGDGLSDYYEHHYGNNLEYDPYHPRDNPHGKSLNPTRWDTDGDGYSDGAEIRRYHTDPLDPNSRPFYLPPCFGPCASPADYDGDGRTDLSVYDPASCMWQVRTWQGDYLNGRFGSATTLPLLGDYDGDGQTDAALYDLLTGNWHVQTMGGLSGSLAFGDSEMIPVPADYDGDFRTDLGLFDPSTGMWYIYPPFTGKLVSFQFGNADCIPVPGDYDGDAKCDFAVYHLADHTWYIYTRRDEFRMFQFGREGCIPVPGDYDGDGRYDFAVYEISTGTWYIYTWTQQFASGQFGWGGVIPVIGDYDGDGRCDPGLYDPATGIWYICTMFGQQYQCQFGSPAEIPVLGGR